MHKSNSKALVGKHGVIPIMCVCRAQNSKIVGILSNLITPLENYSYSGFVSANFSIPIRKNRDHQYLVKINTAQFGDCYGALAQGLSNVLAKHRPQVQIPEAAPQGLFEQLNEEYVIYQVCLINGKMFYLP